MSIGNYSISELLAWLNGKSRTYGWGAIVSYDRRKTNQLLSQLYIERFNSGSYLPLISESMQSSQHSIEHVTGLKLSVPKLSFDTASLDDSRASLTMDFVGGLIMTELKVDGSAPRIDKIQKVLPIGGPQLSMIINLKRANGDVGDAGLVTLDISQGEGFKANFVLGNLSQEMIGSRFKEIFSGLDGDQKIFPLGTLTGDLNGPLTPKDFSILTMAAPGAKNRSAQNYGDGAVLLFVKLEGSGNNTSFPTEGSDFKYLIPADNQGKEYTGTLLLSSRMLFDRLLKADAEEDIGGGLKFVDYDGNDNSAWSLRAKQGGLTYNEDVTVQGQNDKNASCNLKATITYPFKPDQGTPLTVAASDKGLSVVWDTRFSVDYKYHANIPGWWDEHIEGKLACTLNWNSGFTMSLEQGVVVFDADASNLQLSFFVNEYLDGFLKSDGQFSDALLNTRMQERVRPVLNKYLQNFTVPNIDTFLIRNLLFPGHNALQLSDAHIPGDLALFGHIDPARTTATVSPLQAIIEGGGNQQFSVSPALTGLKWSVRGTDPDETDIGSIDANGLYKAPAPSSLAAGYRTVVVTATGKLEGQDVTASALLTVLQSTIAVAPIFQVCGAGGNITLTAEALRGVVPAWSLKAPAQGGKLSATQGGECTYTAAPAGADRDAVYIDTIQVKNPSTNATTEAQMLVLNASINMAVVISAASKPETGTVQLQVVNKSGPVDPPANAVCTLLVSGGGTLSSTGVYTEPANASGFAVVSILVPGDFNDNNGFIVLPLPLSLYADISRRVSDSICAKALLAPENLL